MSFDLSYPRSHLLSVNPRSKRSQTLGGVLTAALFFTTACGGIDLSGPGPDESLPENHPSAVDSVYTIGTKAGVWSENGAEFAYIQSGSKTAVSRSVATGQRRVLYSVGASDFITDVELSTDGNEWFTVTATSGVPGGTLRRHTSNSMEVLATRTKSGGAEKGAVVRSAANGDVFYIVAPDSLFIRRRTGTTEFMGSRCGGIGAIAPAGEGVICYGTQSVPSVPPLLNFSVPGTPPAVVTPSTGESTILSVSWTTQGVLLVYRPDYKQYAFEKVSDPASKFVTPTHEYPESTGSSVSISQKGQLFAYGNTYCAKTSGLLSCGKNQNIYYIADAVSRSVKRIAVHSSHSYPSVALSPDGSTLAYAQDQQLYFVATK